MVSYNSGKLEVAVTKLKSVKIHHPLYETAVREIRSAIFVAQPGEVVCVTGPSRVGKSCATLEACSALLPDNATLAEKHMPLVTTTVDNTSDNSKFKMKGFMADALEAIEHPLYGIPEPDDLYGSAFDRRIVRTPETVLRTAFRRSLRSMGTIYWLIDEAQHLKYCVGGINNAEEVLDCWKRMAEKLGVVLILIGTYPILRVLDTSPHILGRSLPIHFPRYRRNIQDFKGFKEIVSTLSTIIPVKNGRLINYVADLYTQSKGCLGLLLLLLRGALGDSIAKGASELTLSSLIKSSKRPSSSKSIMAEIEFGEDYWYSGSSSDPGFKKARKKKTTKGKPFQKKPDNYKQGNR